SKSGAPDLARPPPAARCRRRLPLLAWARFRLARSQPWLQLRPSQPPSAKPAIRRISQSVCVPPREYRLPASVTSKTFEFSRRENESGMPCRGGCLLPFPLTSGIIVVWLDLTGLFRNKDTHLC